MHRLFQSGCRAVQRRPLTSLSLATGGVLYYRKNSFREGDSADSALSFSAVPPLADVFQVASSNIPATEAISSAAFRLFQAVEDSEGSGDAEEAEAATMLSGDDSDEVNEEEDDVEQKQEPNDDESEAAEEGEESESHVGDNAKRRNGGEPRLLASDFIELKRHFEEEQARIVGMIHAQHQHELEMLQAEMDKQVDERVEEKLNAAKEAMEKHYRQVLDERYRQLNQAFAEQRDDMLEKLQKDYLEAEEGRVKAAKGQRQVHMNMLAELNARIRKLEDLLSNTEERGAADLRRQRLCLAMFSLLTNSLDGRKPFKDDLERVVKESRGHETIRTALEAIPHKVREKGVPTRQELYTKFSEVKSVSRRQSFVPEGGGMLSRAMAYVVAAVTFPEVGLVDGTHPDAIIARAEYYLARGELKKTVDELRELDGMAAVATQDFVLEATDRLMVEECMALVRDYVAQNVAGSESDGDRTAAS